MASRSYKLRWKVNSQHGFSISSAGLFTCGLVETNMRLNVSGNMESKRPKLDPNMTRVKSPLYINLRGWAHPSFDKTKPAKQAKHQTNTYYNLDQSTFSNKDEKQMEKTK